GKSSSKKPNATKETVSVMSAQSLPPHPEPAAQLLVSKSAPAAAPSKPAVDNSVKDTKNTADIKKDPVEKHIELSKNIESPDIIKMDHPDMTRLMKDIHLALDKNYKQNQVLIEGISHRIDQLVTTQGSDKNLAEGQFAQIQSQLTVLQDQQKDLRSKADLLLNKTLEQEKSLKHIDELLVKQAAEFDTAEDLQAVKAPSKVVIHAIIPGRAWLRDQNNKIFSVVEGDEIPGYGKILTIDPRLGTLITNSGQILRY
ncbi:hypothetical protein EBS02_09085, partial [bacterium]|nr:hypothetical protein [bacterium]